MKYYGVMEQQEYRLYLNIEDIDHTKPKVKGPWTNKIYECFHLTMQEEFYAIAFRMKLYSSWKSCNRTSNRLMATVL
jgi:hypothetical protein